MVSDRAKQDGAWTLFSYTRESLEVYPLGEPAEQYEESPIQSEAQLRLELDRIIAGRPQNVELYRCPLGGLGLCLGRSAGAISWNEGVDGSGAFHRVCATTPYAGPPIEFAAYGGNFTMGPEYLLPVEDVIRIVIHFYLHMAFPEDVKTESYYYRSRSR